MSHVSRMVWPWPLSEKIDLPWPSSSFLEGQDKYFRCITLRCVSRWRWKKESKGRLRDKYKSGERESGGERKSVACLPAWLTVDSVGCDFHSLLAVCVEAITSVTGRLINEPLSLSVQFEEGPRPYPRHHWFIRLWSKPPNITHTEI